MSILFDWDVTKKKVTCRLHKEVVFQDSLDHWQNGLCRLMKLEDTSARQWVETAVRCTQEPYGRTWSDCAVWQKVEGIKLGSREFFGFSDRDQDWDPTLYKAISVFDEPCDRLWIHIIGEDTSVAVIGNDRLQHGILVTTVGSNPRPVAPLDYGEDYFEGKAHGLGYGYYFEQCGWRLGKSRRQVRQIKGIAHYLGRPAKEGTVLLDVGSGYGYLRQAASECGWRHEGLEVSRHAARTAQEIFGFSTYIGTLKEFKSQLSGQYDVITFFDVIEHVKDPQSLVKCATELLSEGGLCIIRTPNLLALEMEVFGPYYHSLKMEHLHYFSANSLCHCLQASGLTPVFLTTESHLLEGFLSRQLALYSRMLRGSDIFAVAQKEGV